MKHIITSRLIISISLTVWSMVSIGQNPICDAAFVKIDAKLGKVVYHRVLEQQTLYAIARGYGVPIEEIMAVNPAIKESKSMLPSILVIPIGDEQMVYRIPLFKSKSEFLPVYYQVQKKDNLFRVSRVYFDLPTNLLSNRNHLESESLKEGQTLHIGWLKQNFDPLKIHEGHLLANAPELEEKPKTNLSTRFEAEYTGTNLIDKNEVAFWRKSENTKGLFVMHRYAAQQSVIEIKNPMFDTTVYAKVIGNIPAHLYPQEIDMVISGELAQALGAVDAKFFVRSRYKADRASASR